MIDSKVTILDDCYSVHFGKWGFMKIKMREIEPNNLGSSKKNLTIMPCSIFDGDVHVYSSTVLSFWKYARKKLDVELFSEPHSLFEQRSNEWFGPTVLFTSSMLTENSELVSIYCNVLSSYLYDFFKGSNQKTSVKLKVIYKEKKSSKTTEISFEGDASGIGFLEESIMEVVRKGL